MTEKDFDATRFYAIYANILCIIAIIMQYLQNNIKK